MSEHQMAERMARMEVLLGHLSETTEKIAGALSELVRLDQKQLETSEALQRAFGEIKNLSNRMNAVEQDLIIPKLISRWVIAGVLGVLAIVGSGVLYLVLK